MYILFEEDWLSYPDAIIDWETSNRSAVILASKLRHMGIKNNSFFLALHNPALQGVDPFDENLTLDQKLMIALECRTNPWYYFREVARAPAIAGTTVNRIEFNRANVALWWCFFNHVLVILTQPRQTGKSFSADHLMQLLMNFICDNTQINLMTKDDKLRAINVQRLKDIYDELPPYLQFKTRDDANNTEEITIRQRGNYYKTHVPQMSEKRALNAGRGMTSAIFQVDEAPFQANIDVALPAALSSMGAAVDVAKAEGAPYGTVMTTTAGKKDQKEGKFFYQEYIEPSAPWSEHFYDTRNATELEKLVRTNSRKGVFRIYMVFSHVQLGKSDQWLKQKLEDSGSKGEDANRDFFNVWTSGSASSPLDVDVMDRIAKSLIQPMYQMIFPLGGYIMRWYLNQDEVEEYMFNNDIIVGIDTSDAIGRDGISVVFTSATDGSCVAAGLFNETNLNTFAKFLVQILERWSRTTMIIERRSSGVAVLDILLDVLPTKRIDPFKRLFNWIINDPAEHAEYQEFLRQPLAHRNDVFYARCKKYFGFATSGGGKTNRSELYSATLQQAAKNCGHLVFDHALGGQLLSLETRNGRIDHPEGEHDDLAIGWLLSHWLLIVARNLNSYGIDRQKMLSGLVKVKDLSQEEQVHAMMQMQVRERISTLFELMANEDNEFMLNRYERELRHLDKQLVLEEDDNFSVDLFMTELKEKRRQRRGHIDDKPRNERHYAEQFGYRDINSSGFKPGPNQFIL